MEPESREPREFRGELRDFRRATVASFKALREDMNDGFTEIRGKLDAPAAGQQRIVELIEGLGGGQEAPEA